jgi:threonine aldolase
VPWLSDGYWLELAQHANTMAAELEAGLQARAVPVRFKRGGNMVFADLTPAQHHSAQSAGARYYLWPDHATLDGTDRVTARLVTSWSTTQADVEAFLSALDG